MELSIDLHNIEKGLQQLFKYAFTTNCSLDEESVTSEEAKTLEELDSSEILENFKDVVLNLLKFKREYMDSEKGELKQRSEQFETMLQKAEAEVRNHIRIEHQLKLHIENHQNRIEELERIGVQDKMMITELEEKSGGKKNRGKSLEVEKVRKEMDEKVKSLLESLEKKDKALQKSEFENLKLKTMFEEKARECEVMKKEIQKTLKPSQMTLRISNSIDQLKRKLDIKKIQNGLKGSQVSENFRSERRSAVDNESTKLSLSPYMKRIYTSSTTKKEGSKTLVKIQSRGHIRSISDQKALSSKRTPSR